jgi:hypothetical protein
MTTTTEIKKSQPDKILTSLNPNSDRFNFELWAREVRQQMLTALQKRLSSSQT